MWYLITAIISGAVGAFLMGLVAGAKNQDELNRAFFAGFQKGQEHERKHPHDAIVEVGYDPESGERG